MRPDPANDPALQARRRRARRTAWWLAAIALAVYAGFMLSSMPGR
ncbi:hypothetical protein [Thermomonas alba]|nr:hypothetical protein [Thermomonas alba]